MTATFIARPREAEQVRRGRRQVVTAANAMTVARTAAATVLGLWGISAESFPMLLAGLAVTGIGDVVDGALARRLAQETRLGAVLDVVGTRWCHALLLGGLVSHLPGMAVPIGVYLLQLLLVDSVLSLSFLRWDLPGPSHFHLVDRRIWALNWSRRARTTDTAALLLTTFGAVPALGMVVAVGLTLVRAWSLAVVVSLGPPVDRRPSTGRRVTCARS
ncbi:MAG: CDP-alcohol phosphatidyltransferase family protein [Phycicoccus sp.]